MEKAILEEEPTEPKRKVSKYKTARGKTTRYSCLYSTVPNKSKAPPKV
ncbi:MAG: hypothetical protein KKA79_09610 [Nanoarchaeota archaeon]|nr:hypothetical protein [Nanoarchaeota archaeon]